MSTQGLDADPRNRSWPLMSRIALDLREIRKYQVCILETRRYISRLFRPARRKDRQSYTSRTAKIPHLRFFNRDPKRQKYTHVYKRTRASHLLVGSPEAHRYWIASNLHLWRIGTFEAEGKLNMASYTDQEKAPCHIGNGLVGVVVFAIFSVQQEGGRTEHVRIDGIWPSSSMDLGSLSLEAHLCR